MVDMWGISGLLKQPGLIQPGPIETLVNLTIKFNKKTKEEVVETTMETTGG